MNPILFGRDNEEHIVAVQQLNDTTVRIYKRNSNTISYEDKPFFPYFHLSHKQLIETFSKKFWLKKLEGNNFYQYLCVFPSLSLLWDGIHHTIEKINFKQEQQIRSYTETEHILFRPDINTQYLMQSGKALFKEMQFSDVYRMQLDIETYSKNYRFSNASRIDDRIILIALSDNRGWETVLGNTTISEKELLQQCVKIIQEKNPDVLEGHNIYNFDLPDSPSTFMNRICRIEGAKNPIAVSFICEDYGFNIKAIENTLGFKIHIANPDKNYFNIFGL